MSYRQSSYLQTMIRRYTVNKRVPLLMTLCLAISAGCSHPPTGPPPVIPKGSSESVPGFVNRVWRVASSTTVPPGTLYAFLSDGTLLVTSSTTKAALGMWTFKNNLLTVVEDGRPQPGEIVRLDDKNFQIRLKTTGEPVEIAFLAAAEPLTQENRVSGLGQL